MRPEDLAAALRVQAMHKRLTAADPAMQEAMRPTKEKLLALGAMLWPVMFAEQKGVERGCELLAEKGQAAMRGEADPLWYEAATDAMVPCNQILNTAAALWCDQAFPTVSMPHTYAAALCATSIPDELLAAVRPPWRALYIEVPDGLLSCWNNLKGLASPIVGVLAMVHDNERWAYVAITDSPIMLWRHGLTGRQLVCEDLESSYDAEAFSEPLESMDDRAAAMVGRLVANACLALSDPENVRATRGAQRPAVRQRLLEEPSVRRYLLGRPTFFDCREAIRRYVLHGREPGRKLTVQSLVRGHWKPRLGARMGKPYWILPYWRGPEDAPILTRNVTLGGRP